MNKLKRFEQIMALIKKDTRDVLRILVVLRREYEERSAESPRYYPRSLLCMRHVCH
jgi:hypothetical protein